MIQNKFLINFCFAITLTATACTSAPTPSPSSASVSVSESLSQPTVLTAAETGAVTTSAGTVATSPTTSGVPAIAETASAPAASEEDTSSSEVALTLPSNLIEGSSEEVIRQSAAAQGIREVIFNDDGSVTYLMDQEIYAEFLKSIQDSIDQSIRTLLEGESKVASFLDISYDNTMINFYVLCDEPAFTSEDTIYTYSFYAYSYMYQMMCGIPQEDIYTIVNYVDKDTGDILVSSDSRTR